MLIFERNLLLMFLLKYSQSEFKIVHSEINTFKILFKESEYHKSQSIEFR